VRGGQPLRPELACGTGNVGGPHISRCAHGCLYDVSGGTYCGVDDRTFTLSKHERELDVCSWVGATVPTSGQCVDIRTTMFRDRRDGYVRSGAGRRGQGD
jgi:hypothetical protein